MTDELTYEAARLPYEKRLRIAAAALAVVLRREFALLCKDPAKVLELAEVEELLAETPTDIEVSRNG
jgi:hypothetical protein